MHLEHSFEPRAQLHASYVTHTYCMMGHMTSSALCQNVTAVSFSFNFYSAIFSTGYQQTCSELIIDDGSSTAYDTSFTMFALDIIFVISLLDGPVFRVKEFCYELSIRSAVTNMVPAGTKSPARTK